MPKISVIIATYNCKDYILDTVRSATSQTVEDLEIIIVDDCSSDGTKDLIVGLTDPRIKTVFLERNLGPSGSRNEGMLLASGEFIAFLDHDDIWSPEKLEKQLMLFQRDREVGLVYSDCLLIDKFGEAFSGNKKRCFDFVKPRRGNVFPELLTSSFIPTSSVVFKRKIVEEIGLFDPKFLISQDFDYYLKISKVYKVDFIPYPLVKHRWLVGVRFKKMETTLREAIEVTKSHTKGRNFSFVRRILISRSLMDFYKELGFLLLKERRPNEARRNFLTAVLAFPFHPKPYYGLLSSLIRCNMKRREP